MITVKKGCGGAQAVQSELKEGIPPPPSPFVFWDSSTFMDDGKQEKVSITADTEKNWIGSFEEMDITYPDVKVLFFCNI
jgi:hypothetical protein